MEKFTSLRGIAAPLMRSNIDTGAIIAPIYMLSRSIDLGQKLFANWRYDLGGAEVPDFVLNQPRYRNSRILLAGPNFGCGSSREGAVWALMRFGIRCVIAPGFGEIFFNNACQNGLLPVRLTQDETQRLADAVIAAGEPYVTVDLVRCVVGSPAGDEVAFELAADRRTSFLEGLDETSLVLRYEAEIDAYQERLRAAQPWVLPAKAAPGSPDAAGAPPAGGAGAPE